MKKQDIKDSIEALKKQAAAFFKKFENLKFLSAKLKDGTAVEIEGEEVKVGAKVTVTTEAGPVDAPDGEHELEDGTKFKTEGGVITEVTPADNPPADPPATPTEEQMAEIAKLKESNAALEARIKTLEGKYAADIKKLSGEVAEGRSLLKAGFDVIEKVASAASEKPTSTVKNPFSKKETDINQLVQAFKTALNK